MIDFDPVHDVPSSPEQIPPCSLCGASFKAPNPDCLRCECRPRVFAPPTPEEIAAARESSRQLQLELEAKKAAEDARIAKLKALGRPVRVALVGCGAKKLDGSHPARELYTGNLFRGALEHAEAIADEVLILSARYGVVELDRVIESYDQRLGSRKAEREAWGNGVVAHLRRHYAGLQVELVVLAGKDYADQVTQHRLGPAFTVSRPLEGLQLGERLQWFKVAALDRAAAAESSDLKIEPTAPPRVPFNSGLHRVRPDAAPAELELLQRQRWMVHKSQNGEFLGGVDGWLTKCRYRGVTFYVREHLRGDHFGMSAGERWAMKKGDHIPKKLHQALELCAPADRWEELAELVRGIEQAEVAAGRELPAREVHRNLQFTTAWAERVLLGGADASHAGTPESILRAETRYSIAGEWREARAS